MRLLKLVARIGHDVFQPAACDEATDLFGPEPKGAVNELWRRATDVGRDHTVGCGPEGMTGGQRFGICDVENGSYAVTLERLDQGTGDDDRSAGGVDQQRTRFHQADLCGADQSVGFCCQRHDDDHDVRRGEESMQLCDGGDPVLLSRAAGYSQNFFYYERFQARFNGHSYRAVADDQDRLLREIVAKNGVLSDLRSADVHEPVGDGGLALPLVTKLHVAIEGEAFLRREDRGQDPLGCGDVVESASVAEDNIFWEPRGDPVHACHHGLHDFDAAEALEGVLGAFEREGKDPEIDILNGLGLPGNTDDLGFRREACEEFLSQIFIDTDTHHALSVHESRIKKKARHEAGP